MTGGLSSFLVSMVVDCYGSSSIHESSLLLSRSFSLSDTLTAISHFPHERAVSRIDDNAVALFDVLWNLSEERKRVCVRDWKTRRKC